MMFGLSPILCWFETWSAGATETFALAVAATLAYLIGCNRRRQQEDPISEQTRRELRRASSITRRLENIGATVRKDLEVHLASVVQFKAKVAAMNRSDNASCWRELCDEAEHIFTPTLRLATQLSHAYDQIREQSAQLLTFTEVRTDPLTGVSNRRALDEQLEVMFAMMNRYDRPFSIAILDIDHFKAINDREGHLYGDQVLQQVAKHFDESVRETDFVARYGGEEFVVLMPQTQLAGANIFGERLRIFVEQEMDITVSGGVAEAIKGDNPDILLSRADSALYSAKAAGRNCMFYHNGRTIRPYPEAVGAADSQVDAALPVAVAQKGSAQEDSNAPASAMPAPAVATGNDAPAPSSALPVSAAEA